MESLAAYIPIDRRQAMARGQSLPDRSEGAVLFADISGFSTLTDVLLRELGSRRGAEEMTRQLILVYTALIAELHRFRGSVIGFAGDSITCWLDGDDGRRAVACALAMQHVMEQFAEVKTPAGMILSITVKVAIAAGPVRRFVVGDPQIQVMDVLAGSTLDRVALAEQYSERQEVVVTEEVATALGDDLEIVTWRSDEESGPRFAVAGRLLAEVADDPWPELPADSLSVAQEQPWLLPAVYEKLRTGRDQYFAELRPAVPLFLRFTGLDYDRDPAAGEKLDAFIRWVQHVANRYEAHIIQLTIGDKGSYLYIPFGVPIAHDDDAARAVATAQELQAIPADLAYIQHIQIGISQGRVWAGACGSPSRRTYAAMGNEVNMAARLMSRAQSGEIMVSQRVFEAAGKLYNFKHLGTIIVKGRQEPMPVYLAQDIRMGSATPTPAALFTDPLVGRDDTMAGLEEILAGAASGEGRIVQIEGPVGIGKSHLAAALAEQASQRGWLVTTGACQSIAQDTAYYPWQQLMRSLLGIEREAEAGESQSAFQVRQMDHAAAIISNTNPDWQIRLPLLGDLLGLPIPDNPTTAALEPRLRQRALFALVAEIVAVWSQARPLFFLLEDAHWMDEVSLGLCNAFGHAIARMPVCFLLVHRPLAGSDGRQQTQLPNFSSLPYYHHLELGELSPAGIATLVTNRLQGRPADLTLAFIQAKAQGNPFFAAELLNNLRESGRVVVQENGEWWLAHDVFEALRRNDCLVKHNGQWLLAENAPLSAVDLGLPASIHGTVLSRIDRLPESHKLTLKVASVVGRLFRLDLLASSHPTQSVAEAIRVEVAEIEARDFVYQDRSQGQQVPAYYFKHNVTQEVAYETLLFTQRQQLHQAVGRSLEQLQPDEIEQIAYHTFVGEDWRRALRYQQLAGREAQQHFANQEAADHYHKALQCADHLPAAETAAERLSIHITLGELYVNTGQYELAQEQLNQALTLAKERKDSDGQARACRWFARLHENRGEYQPALDWIQKGLLALVSQETDQVAELLLIAGLINTRQGDYDNATALCEHSLVIGQKLGNLSVLARAYNLMGIITRTRGNTATAINHFENSFQLYEQANDIHGQARSHNEIANAYFYTGQWTKADHHYRAARHIFKQVGDVYNQIVVDNNLGGIAWSQGRLDDALASYQQALHAQEQIGGSLWILGVLHMNLGHTSIQRGEVEAAYHHLNTSQDYFSRAQARDFLPEMHRYFAEAALRTGDLAAAESHAQTSKGLASEMGLRSEEGNILRVLGEIAAAAGRLEEGEVYLRQSLAILQEVGDQFEGARSQLSLARLYEQWQKPGQAKAALADCLPIFEQLDAALEAAKAREVQGRLGD
jgi:adenylate cyclase